LATSGNRPWIAAQVGRTEVADAVLAASLVALA